MEGNYPIPFPTPVAPVPGTIFIRRKLTILGRFGRMRAIPLGDQ
jgi:hypothetical protein